MEFNTQTLLIIFVAITGLAVLLQACVLIAIMISLQKTAKSVAEVMEEIHTTVIPMVQSTRRLMERVGPQILTVTDQLVEVTQSVRDETAEVRRNLAEVLERLQRQSQRLDAMLSTGLDAMERAGHYVETTVSAPVRQVNGVLNAVRAAVDVFRTWPTQKNSTHSGDAKDMFI